MAVVEPRTDTLQTITPDFPLRDFEAVLRLHQALLAVYATALRLASRPTRRRDPSRRWTGWRPPETLRPRAYGARKLCESHVKRKLAVLASIYEQDSLASTVDAERAAYETAASECQKFAETLSFWRLPTWLAVLPLAGGTLSTLGGALEGVPVDDPTFLALAAFYVLYLGGFGVAVVLKAFQHKRTVFFPAWKSAERLRSRLVEKAQPHERNVYRSEEEVFRALGRGRPLEQPLDSYVLLVAAAVFAGAASVSPEVFLEGKTSEAWPFVLGPIIGLSVGVAASGWMLLRQRNRRWR